ncbi:hypothetical protein CEY00_Acc03360 [Actinidia chinensis var. chinensis]|uniref:Uncharacterized protein n=1 Tax=Actinidia chinensis var. chinensis TaxID=1590841 RepID=A0A2R6REV8_ACTCC|nr:hypothetical protein CEY00_Acc03360 [Actinidia chinensis var. chinensis]
MASAGEEDNDAVLSDVEADDPVPISIKSPSPEDVSAERFREVLAELDRERQAREATENSKSDLQVSFNRLKVLAHEAIKKRDEYGRQRDEAMREKDEALKQRDEIAKQFDEAVKAKDSSRSEMETGTQMLVTGIEKISGKTCTYWGLFCLANFVAACRAETSLLKEHVEAQTKELNHRNQRIEELEEKERVANENVEGLMMDIAAAEEEITRWKVAAQQEAAAGKAVEQEFVAQLSAVRHELEEAKQAVMESEKKLKFKEETAAAAMAARDAAEKSLRLADMRASRLRDRVEELTQQLEQLDTRQNLRGLTGPRYVCWPWEWLGLSFVGAPRSATQQQSSNEMELSEPLV